MTVAATNCDHSSAFQPLHIARCCLFVSQRTNVFLSQQAIMFNAVSTPVSVGSVVFAVLALLAVSLVVLVVLRHYLPLRSTPGFYLVPIFFALWLPSIIVLLVPIDLASSAGTDDEATRGIWLPERVILVSWRITYWLAFALTWYVLTQCLTPYE